MTTPRNTTRAKPAIFGGRGRWRFRFPVCYAHGRRGFDRFRKSGLRRSARCLFTTTGSCA